MNSSISPFKGTFAVLVGSLVIGFTASVIYTIKLNPEIDFWKKALEVKSDWIASARKDLKPLTFFSGGSSTAFQINCQLLKDEFGARAVNLGMHAGMGLDGTVAIATKLLKKGDRLVLMTEPSILSQGGGTMTPLGSQLIVATGGTHNTFFQTTLGGPPEFQMLAECRPGLSHAATMAGKILSNRPSYRYQTDDIHLDGFLTTPIREELSQSNNGVKLFQLSPQAIIFLTELKSWSDQRGIELVYALPVCFVPEKNIARQRAANQAFLQEVGKILPTWPDNYMGAWSISSDFADTAQHMTEDAAKIRTRKIGETRFSP